MRLSRAAFGVFLACLVALSGGIADTARAALSEVGGTGVLELQSAESKRPARLELGISGLYQGLDLRDSSDTRLNVLRAAANAAFGLPGGFEISGTVPAVFHYTSRGAAATPWDEELDVKLGDVTGRMRWTGPLGVPGLRWGLEGEVLFATGSDHEETYPGRATVKPYTVGKNSYTARSMMTWDGLRAGSGVPLRLHANAAYTVQQDEGRFVIPRAPLPLELGSPGRDRDNDFASLGAAVELDLPRLTLFGEVVTDQFVYERTLLKGKENRIVATPGLRLWFPGGVSLMGAYTVSLSEDDEATAFDPGRAFPDGEWRVALSLGTVYRGARARAEEEVVVAPVPAPMPAVPPAPAAVLKVAAEPAEPDSATLAKLRRDREIMERRDVQEEPTVAKSAVAGAASGVTSPEVAAAPAARPVAPTAPVSRYADTDRDGIPDATDQCPLLAEDFDGFQDLDGCPDLDNDQDGIPDVRDQCPNDPETYNGFYDFDGCPDEAAVRWVGPQGRPLSPALPEAPAPPDTSAMMPADTAAASPARAARLAKAAPVAAPAQGLVLSPTTPTAQGPGTGRPSPAVAPAVGRADSMTLALQFERERVRSLEERLAQSEAERRELTTKALAAPLPAAPESIAPASVPVPKVVAPAAAVAVPAPAGERADSLKLALQYERDRVKSLETRLAQSAVPAPAGERADSLKLALQYERDRVRSLETMLAQSDAERRDLTAKALAAPRPAAPESVAAAPAPGASASRAELRSALDEIQRQNAELRTRVRDLESQQALQRAALTPPAAVPTGTTLITAPGTTAVPDPSARVAALERELSELRRQTALQKTPADTAGTAGTALAARVAEIEAQLAALQSAPETAAPPPQAATPSAGAAEALDILLPTGTPRVFPEVAFRSGSVRLAPEALPVLSGIAAALREVPGARVKIVGHTDDVGLAAANLALSRERAQAVANALIGQGVDRGQLTVEGRGEEAPVASNRTVAGRQLNRRVEFVRVR